MRKYNQSIIDQICRLYPTTKTDVIARKFNMAAVTVYKIASDHNIRKSPEYMAKMHKRTSQNLKLGAHTRFTPGHTPFNKGKKMPAETKAKLKFFDKGHVPHNIRPDFSERVSNDGYVEIKVPGKGFQLKHRYLWESIHGAIPHGCIVTFIDGNKMNVKIENLQLITKRENMNRNNINRLPQELINVIKQNSKLKTHINAKQNR